MGGVDVEICTRHPLFTVQNIYLLHIRIFAQ